MTPYDLEEVRTAVSVFVEHYNKYWLVEKLGFKSPTDARENHGLRMAA